MKDRVLAPLLEPGDAASRLPEFGRYVGGIAVLLLRGVGAALACWEVRQVLIENRQRAALAGRDGRAQRRPRRARKRRRCEPRRRQLRSGARHDAARSDRRPVRCKQAG